jgi:hypothetical protein
LVPLSYRCTVPLPAITTEDTVKESHLRLAQNTPTPAAIIASTAISKSNMKGPGAKIPGRPNHLAVPPVSKITHALLPHPV